jgi:predicted HTH domain antitoxin
MGKAAELADMSVARFQLQLGARQIGPHYGVQDALDDSATLAAFRRAGSSSPIRPH